MDVSVNVGRLGAAASSFISKPHKLLIDAKWVAAKSGKTFAVFDPATGSQIAAVADGGPEDIDAAVKAARKAFEDGPWGKMKPTERGKIVWKLADILEQNLTELAEIESIDNGKPVMDARMVDVPFSCELLRYMAGWATKITGQSIPLSTPGDWHAYSMREPLGVVGQIIPWNFPLMMAVWKIAPALTAGCTIVLKPAEQTPLSAIRLGDLVMEAGFPPGVLNIVTGNGTPGAALAAHPDVDKVAFIGSHVAGQKIVQASSTNLKRVSLELGGKSPDIVFADADLDAAVPGAAMAVFANSGQICSAGTRLFVEKKVYEEFTDKVAAFSKTPKVGNGANPETQVGPLVSSEQLDRVTTYLGIGRQEGARSLSGGQQLTEGEYGKGYFVPPTVFANVRDDMRIAQEEIFGPVISAVPFTDIEEVTQRGNATTFGLGGGVWTRDVTKAVKLAKSIRAGSVWINCYRATDPAVPFGGYKMSGYGRESGKQHLEEYLNVKAVWIKTA